jgi:hypothetical protein
MTTILEVFAGSASAADSKGRKEISSGERALTMLEGQNTFSYADE